MYHAWTCCSPSYEATHQQLLLSQLLEQVVSADEVHLGSLQLLSDRS